MVNYGGIHGALASRASLQYTRGERLRPWHAGHRRFMGRIAPGRADCRPQIRISADHLPSLMIAHSVASYAAPSPRVMLPALDGYRVIRTLRAT